MACVEPNTLGLELDLLGAKAKPGRAQCDHGPVLLGLQAVGKSSQGSPRKMGLGESLAEPGPADCSNDRYEASRIGQAGVFDGTRLLADLSVDPGHAAKGTGRQCRRALEPALSGEDLKNLLGLSGGPKGPSDKDPMALTLQPGLVGLLVGPCRTRGSQPCQDFCHGLSIANPIDLQWSPSLVRGLEDP